jgi:two-component system, NarL family, sensor kinase
MQTARRVSILLFMMCCCRQLAAQGDPYRDSLQKLIRSGKADTIRVMNLITLGQYEEANAPELAKQYYRKAADLSKKLEFAKGEMKFYFNYTAALNVQGRYDSSLALNKESLVRAEAIGDPVYIASAENNLGAVHHRMGNSEEAISHYLRSVTILETLKDSARLSITYDGIGVLYSDIGWQDKALEYHLKAAAMSTGSSIDQRDYSMINAAVALKRLKRYDTALVILKQVVEEARKAGNVYIEYAGLQNQGDILIAKGMFAEIGPVAKEALSLARKIGDPDGEVRSMHLLSLAHFYLGDDVSAAAYATEALRVNLQVDLKEQEAGLYSILANIALVNGDRKRFDSLNRKAEGIIGDLREEEVRKNVQAADRKYELAKKEQQLVYQAAELRQARWQRTLLVSGLLLSGVLTGLLAYALRQRTKAHRNQMTVLENEKRLLATQQLLRGQEEERNRFAKDLHDGLGGMLSGIKLQLGAMKGNLIMSEDQAKVFGTALDRLDESIREMRRVAHNLMPEALLRLGLRQAVADYCDTMANMANVRINAELHGLENRMEESREVVVYRVVQELINNAIKHSGATEILVQLIRRDDLLSITVEDNGRGFDPSAEPAGSGLRNIRSRLEYLNGHMDIQSTPGSGSSFHIECQV